jgi:orotate phosphoribosyltransferase
MRVGCEYFAFAYRPTSVLVSTVLDTVGQADFFDTMVGMGLSGSIFAARTAPAMSKSFAIVRKDDDKSTHSHDIVEGRIGSRWIFVDDFIDTGATFRDVYRKVTQELEALGMRSEFVGALVYDNPRFYTPDDLHDFHYDDDDDEYEGDNHYEL